MQKIDVLRKYNLPEIVKYCVKCTISNQRPRITFDENGVCSACNFAEFKRTKIDWKLREKELEELCDKYRKRDGSYDVVVPCSGGKDGSYVAHLLKYKYGMNPLTVTWAPHIPTEIGRQNLDNFIQSGFDNILGTPNGKIHRLMTKLSFIHVGDPFQPFIYGQTNFPLRVAVQNSISLIMYGENGEVEYGGDMKNAFKPTRDIQDHDKHYFSGLPPEFWTDKGVNQADIYPYKAPEYEKIVNNKTEIHFMGYYTFWDPQENYYYCSEHTGFNANTERSEGTYSKYASLDDKIDGFHYYLAYIKFGLGRTTSDAAHEIRDNKITREEGIALIKRYDGEFPQKHYKAFLDYCDITEDQFWEVINCWRAEHLWIQENGTWKLRKPIWLE
ncbi:hypothetical protein PAECIP111891_04310 [Paenibacillus allorhizoplanae]|uniref:N-acetyl sugar amidotransferase n=1 Tax=Paenibacillus allorhizoplanae TaxID=2905648 RepID=A0ABM9CJB1_9BACL|nr:N-acetyl sugar amidotransferase [Paenibacillus allorhizoplanae]CAH1215776.1 hypothetical protein PAECIP111891_04310 [Paenibacillus allorhizoplanae]